MPDGHTQDDDTIRHRVLMMGTDNVEVVEGRARESVGNDCCINEGRLSLGKPEGGFAQIESEASDEAELVDVRQAGKDGGREVSGGS